MAISFSLPPVTQQRTSPMPSGVDGQNGAVVSFMQYVPYALQMKFITNKIICSQLRGIAAEVKLTWMEYAAPLECHFPAYCVIGIDYSVNFSCRPDIAAYTVQPVSSNYRIYFAINSTPTKCDCRDSDLEEYRRLISGSSSNGSSRRRIIRLYVCGLTRKMNAN